MKDAKCLRNEDETIEQLNRLIGSGQALRNGHLEWLSTRTDLMRVFTCCCRLWDSFYEPLLEACSKIKFEKHFDLRMKIERVIDEGVELFHEFHKMVSDRSCEEQKREIVLMDLLLKTGDLLSLKYNLQTPHSLYKTSIKDVMNVYLSIEGSKYQSARALEYEKLSRLLMNERGQPYLLGSVYYGLLSLEMANGSKEVAEDSRKDIKSRIRTLVSDIIVKSGAIEKVEIYVGLQKDSFFT
ncbi:hypothetical protein ACOME3_001863 [Neoechinorhynchus agilis]